MALIDDALQILKFTGKTALLGMGVIVGIRVLAPLLLPYCKPLAKEAVKGYAALLDKLPIVGGEPKEPEEAEEVAGMPEAPTAAAAQETLPEHAPAMEKAAKAAGPRAKATKASPNKAKIAKLRPYQQWSKTELYKRAKDLEIAGRSTMNKTQLIKAIRAVSQ